MPFLFQSGDPHRGCTLMVMVAAFLPLAAVALAQVPDDSDLLFPQDQLCPIMPGTGDPLLTAAGSDLVPRRAVMALLLGENMVRDSTLDADGDGNTLIDEKIQALTNQDFCSLDSVGCNDADRAALAKAQAQLQSFAEAGGGAGYRIEELDVTGKPLPGSVASIDGQILLEELGRSLQIRCIALPKAADPEAELDYWQTNGNGEDGFRLSGDVDNLSKSRGSLGAVKAAELSITSDLIEDETAWRVNAVAGYAFSAAAGNDARTSLTPFLQFERVTSGSETQIDTVGAGFQQALQVNWPGALRSEFAVTPVYETDSEFEAATGLLKFRWTPTLSENTGFPLGFSRVLGPVELRFGLDFLADAGRVFIEGDGNNLDGEGNFFRPGSQAALQLRGAPGYLFRQFELQIADQYLYNADAQFEHINQFDAAIAYLFPGNENYQLSFAYSNGRDDGSLELYELWQTQFGIRF